MVATVHIYRHDINMKAGYGTYNIYNVTYAMEMDVHVQKNVASSTFLSDIDHVLLG